MAKAPTAKRYAEALFALADQQGKAEEWQDSLRRIADVVQEPTAAMFFSEPRIPAERKADAVAQVVQGEDPLLGNFLGLIVQRQATRLVPAIADAYAQLINERAGRAFATVTAAATLSKAQQDRLRESLGKMLEKEVVLDVKQDEGIMGGIVVRVGDQIIDGSVRSRLSALRHQLSQETLA